MSLLWGYSPHKCDGEWCPNDCDHCYKADFEVRTLAVLERVSQSRATPERQCDYPECEKCDYYHAHYCTVPIVVSKQIFRMTEEKIYSLEKKLAELEALVVDSILKSNDEQMTWDEVNPPMMEVGKEDR